MLSALWHPFFFVPIKLIWNLNEERRQIDQRKQEETETMTGGINHFHSAFMQGNILNVAKVADIHLGKKKHVYDTKIHKNRNRHVLLTTWPQKLSWHRKAVCFFRLIILLKRVWLVACQNFLIPTSVFLKSRPRTVRMHNRSGPAVQARESRHVPDCHNEHSYRYCSHFSCSTLTCHSGCRQVFDHIFR